MEGTYRQSKVVYTVGSAIHDSFRELSDHPNLLMLCYVEAHIRYFQLTFDVEQSLDESSLRVLLKKPATQKLVKQHTQK